MMQAFCNCGKLTFWGSDSPRRCQGCDECGTNFYGEETAPHEFKPVFNSNTGKPDGGRCKRCYERDKTWEHPE